jgi:MFS family permease
MGLMLAWNDDYRAVFWVAVIPAMLCVVLVVFGVEEPPRLSREGGNPAKIPLRSLGSRLRGNDMKPFWVVVAAASALTLARFSEAFLILRAADLGVKAAYAPLVLAGMSVVYAVTAYPAGRLADRMAPRTLLAAGIAALVAADIVLALAPNVATLAAGIALWGLHMGLTQGLLAAMVAHTAPADLRGTAFGVFNLAMGLAMLLASAIAGALWFYVGPAATFWTGAALAAAALAITRLARA